MIQLKKTLQEKDYKLYHDDCLNILPLLEGNVDLVLVDLPYGMTDCKWDSIIPFNEMWRYLQEISHPTTTYLFFGVEPFSTKLRYSNMSNYRYDLYWIKSRCTGFLHANNKPLSNVELISVFSNGYVNHEKITDKRMTYNPQGLKIIDEPKTLVNKGKKDKQTNRNQNIYNNSSFKNKNYTPKYTNYPKQVLHFNSVKKTIHPTQKPVDLLEYLVKTYSNTDDTVLDFTMGSGSTGVACMSTGRKFIGIEKNEDYYNIASERIKDASIQQRIIY